MSKIDAAIAAAKARKAARGEPEGLVVMAKPAKVPKEPKTPKEPKEPKKVKPPKEEREAKVAELERLRAERKAAKEVERQVLAEAKAAAKKPAHVAKLDRAAAKLPKMSATAEEIFGDVTVNLSREQIDALAQHLMHWNRVKATVAASTAKIEVGQEVRIVSGDKRYLGFTGTVAKAQRIRCYVDIPELEKTVYLFTSDVEVLEAEETQATGTEG